MSTRIASFAAVLQIVAKERAWNALGGVVLRAVGGVRCVCVLCLLKIMGDLCVCVLCVPGYVCALVVRVLGDGCVVLGDGCCAEVARAKSTRRTSTTRWTRRRRNLLNNALDPAKRPLTHGPGPWRTKRPSRAHWVPARPRPTSSALSVQLLAAAGS